MLGRSSRVAGGALFLAVGVAAVLISAPAGAKGGGLPAFSANVRASVQSPPGWDEPSGLAAGDGTLYTAFQNPNATPASSVSSSTDGTNWADVSGFDAHDAAKPQGDMGDVTVATDKAGTIFVGHLTKDLQTDIDYSTDGGHTWQTAAGVTPALNSSTSPFLVDRPWITASSPDSNRLHTTVYLEYHDFVPSLVYVVTCSMATGSLQCGAPVPVSNTQAACNSIPGGIAVAPMTASAHPGRVYAVWSTADPATNILSGCNETQLAPFYAIDVAYSDTPAVAGSWHQAPVYAGPTGDPKCPDTTAVGGVATATCADVSEIFTPVAVDNAGNAYVAFVDFIDTLRPAYDVYVEHSTDGGTTWNGKADGSGVPTLVGASGGTHFLPNLVAGDAGRVAVGYYATSFQDRPFEAGDTCPVGVPPELSCQGKAMPEPPNTAWVYKLSESTNAASAAPSYTEVQVSDPGVVPHYGDICNLGIYCDGSSSGNRSVFDSTTVYVDRHGYVQAAWSDQRSDPTAEVDAAGSSAQSAQVAYDEVWQACQTAGPSLLVRPGGPSLCARSQ